MLDERLLGFVENLLEISGMSGPGQHLQVDEQQPQNRLNADAPSRDMHPAVNDPSRHVQVRVAA